MVENIADRQEFRCDDHQGGDVSDLTSKLCEKMARSDDALIDVMPRRSCSGNVVRPGVDLKGISGLDQRGQHQRGELAR